MTVVVVFTVFGFTTIPNCVPVVAGVPVSVAVMDCVPAVLKVRLNVATPLSLFPVPDVNGWFAGRVAAASELVKCTVPV